MSAQSKPNKSEQAIINSVRKRLLFWYDENHRHLPWRANPGQESNPYHVWLSEIMLQQTVVKAVIPYFLKFIRKWPTINDLAEAERDDVLAEWAGLGYYARARNLHKCAQIVTKEHNGVFPSDIKILKKLPGIGDYTSAAIRAIAFDKPANVVDGNIERVMARYYNVLDYMPDCKKQLRDHANHLSEGRTDRPGDFAQALMDLGAMVCIPKMPRCVLCPLIDDCKGYKAGTASDLPLKRPKQEKPKRFGYIYWVLNEKGQFLWERRKNDVLLGGMAGLPTSEWLDINSGKPEHLKDMRDIEKNKKTIIKHSFTHFDLELEGYQTNAVAASFGDKEGYFWADLQEIDNLGFPTVFKKFVTLVMHD